MKTLDEVWEGRLRRIADQAASQRSLALSAITAHVWSAAELVRARVDEHGGDREAQVAGLIDALRADLNSHLDRLAATRPGS